MARWTFATPHLREKQRAGLESRQTSTRQFPAPKTPNGAEIVISAPQIQPLSETFQHIRHQRPRKVAAEPFQGGRIFLQKGWQVRGGLVLLAEHIVLVLVENLAVP